MGFLRASEAVVEPLVLEREAFVVNSQQMQDRRVKIPDMDRILDNVVTEVVRLTVDRSPV